MIQFQQPLQYHFNIVTVDYDGLAERLVHLKPIEPVDVFGGPCPPAKIYYTACAQLTVNCGEFDVTV